MDKRLEYAKTLDEVFRYVEKKCPTSGLRKRVFRVLIVKKDIV